MVTKMQQHGSKRGKPNSKIALRENGMWSIPKIGSAPLGERIAFVGPMASGKTYCAKYLETHSNYRRMALADKLKSIAYELYGVINKDSAGRQMYQELGDSLRKFDDDVFTKYLLNRVKEFHPLDKIVIDDVRLPREAQLLHDAGFIIIGVNTPQSVRDGRVSALYPDLSQARRSHATEVSWSGIPLDASVGSTTQADMVELDRLVRSYDTG